MPGTRDRKQIVETATEEVEGTEMKSSGRECPIPKPGGMVGEMLGFKRQGVDSRIASTQASRPP